MAKNPNRRDRTKIKEGELFIYGEGITERYYFTHLKKLSGFGYKIHRHLFDSNLIDCVAKIKQEIRKYTGTPAKAIFVLDGDIYNNNIEFKQLQELHKSSKDIIISVTQPEFEYWFLTHFIQTNKQFTKKQLLTELRKYLPNYEKREKYLKNIGWFESLYKGQNGAISYSKQSKKCTGSYSDFYKVLDVLK
ncbi:MAG: hypothetical protein B6226_02965 [Candidatus Cloacimonetes bacterium 4572_65]|nr:MAG: hypothetical protein B6226_02965 [Candidatus Cloacimonetes bacterium 4572_65]